MRHKNTPDNIMVNINEQWELEWWPWRLGISKKELVQAVNSVGPALENIKVFLSRKN